MASRTTAWRAGSGAPARTSSATWARPRTSRPAWPSPRCGRPRRSTSSGATPRPSARRRARWAACAPWCRSAAGSGPPRCWPTSIATRRRFWEYVGLNEQLGLGREDGFQGAMRRPRSDLFEPIVERLQHEALAAERPPRASSGGPAPGDRPRAPRRRRGRTPPSRARSRARWPSWRSRRWSSARATSRSGPGPSWPGRSGSWPAPSTRWRRHRGEHRGAQAHGRGAAAGEGGGRGGQQGQERVPGQHEPRAAHALNAIIGYSEMLAGGGRGRGPRRRSLPDLRKIKGAGKHLLALINDILDLSKIEAGKMELYLETSTWPTWSGRGRDHPAAGGARTGTTLRGPLPAGPRRDARRPDQGAADPVQPAEQRLQVHRRAAR